MDLEQRAVRGDDHTALWEKSDMHMREACMLGTRLASAVAVFGLLFALSASASDGDENTTTIGLALGSGGATGLAHIAMLQVFDDLERKPDHLAGTSIGAVIGALYASGLSAEQIKDIFDDFSGSSLDVLSGLVGRGSELSLGDVVRVGFDDGGVFDSTGFLDFLAEKMPVTTFEELRVPLSIVATDYWTGDVLVLDTGALIPAMKASMAVPGLFPPVAEGDRLLIDGGTSNPLPFDVSRRHADHVIAVDVTGSRSKEAGAPTWVDLLFKTFEIMQQSIIAARMHTDAPSLYLKPDIRGVRLLDFNKLDKVLEQSEETADELRAHLRALPGDAR
jgi:NTE family protein